MEQHNDVVHRCVAFLILFLIWLARFMLQDRQQLALDFGVVVTFFRMMRLARDVQDLRLVNQDQDQDF